MKLNAYILAADPAWIEASVLSYYDLVERIVVSYDQDGLSWTGAPIDTEQCLKRLRAIDTSGKFDYRPGHFARPGFFSQPLMNDTFQRQEALNQASDGADWVLQLDTDEILGDAIEFFSALNAARSGGFEGMDYPARWLYRQIDGTRYLETCSRFWGIAASYPGPVAVKARTELRLCRQCDADLYRVDFRKVSTSSFHSRKVAVHRVIQPSQAIFHFSWVRDHQEMLDKSNTSSHARDFDWEPFLKRWIWSGKHPYLASLLTPLQRRVHTRRLRITRLPAVSFPVDLSQKPSLCGVTA